MKIAYSGSERKAPMKAVRMTLKERRAMVREWLAGADVEAVAKRYGVHPGYVRKAASRAGFRKREQA